MTVHGGEVIAYIQSTYEVGRQFESGLIHTGVVQ